MKQAEQLFGFMKESNDFPKDWGMGYLRRLMAFSVALSDVIQPLLGDNFE